MGRIKSIQSFSTVDGPGPRVVVFFQGCPVGCAFCHNPDSWDLLGGEEINGNDLLRRIERFRSFLPSPPGLTLSGGEPLAQPDFAFEVAKKSRFSGWHVALDTSGWGSPKKFLQVAEEVDLVMFSIKHPLHPEKVSQIRLTSVYKNWVLLATLSIPVWLRYVLIKDWTDSPAALKALGKMAAELPNLEKIQILPFNSLAENKWLELGWKFNFSKDKNRLIVEEQIKAAEKIVYAQWRAEKGEKASPSG